MAALKKLKPGMVVYDVHSHSMGNTKMRSLGCWEIRILDVDYDKGVVTASWNTNPPEKFYRNAWSKWRVKEPVLITMAFGGQRLATRAELKEMKERQKNADA